MNIASNLTWIVVYILLGIALIIGLRACKPRTISLKKLLLLPTLFTMLNIFWLTERLGGRYALFPFWVVGLVFGTMIGWESVRSWKTKADRNKKHLLLPASFSTLILVLIVFGARYFFVYHYEFHEDLPKHFLLADAIASGLITGIFIGRSLQLYKKYYKG